MMRYKTFAITTVLILTSVFGCFLLHSETGKQKIDQWLLLGPAPITPIESQLLQNEDKILAFNHIPIPELHPVKGEKVNWTGNRSLTWQVTKRPDISSTETGVFYLAAYLEPSRWLQTELVLETPTDGLKVALFLDGESVDATPSKDKITANLDLTNEKHLIVLKGVLSKGKRISVNAFFEYKAPFQNETLRLSVSPLHQVNTENILNVINVTGVRLSPDGKLAAVFLSQMKKDTGKNERWMEIINTSTGDTVFSSENFGNITGIKWLNHSHGFTYSLTKDEKTSILRYDLNNHRQHVVLKDIENFADYTWADNNSFFIYYVSHPDENKKGYKFIKDIPDRSTVPAPPQSMYIYYPGQGDNAAGVCHQISDKTQKYETAVISPDSRKVLLIKNESDYKNPPYLKYVIDLFDVKSEKIEPLLESYYLQAFQWAPDSERLLVLGGPSAFDNLGRDLPKGIIPNEFDNQAYIYDIKTKKAEVISKNFVPSINSAFWNSSAGNIYFIAEDRSFVRIYKYAAGKKNFIPLETGVDAVRAADFARDKSIAVFWGSSVTTPHRLYRLNLSSGKASILKDYNRDAFRDVVIGKYENWDFKTKEGKTIMGRIYFPPGFDRTKKYPCIVYYYGGTSPVSRDFGGRYPQSWYAANGYVTYVLQPTGATGFGQESSAVHVNDWGNVTSKEIIAAVKELTRVKTYIDPKRVGAMGASYGGFMTQYLATQTDIFAAFISHAGISSISSYWGVGDWGYTYSGFATTGSFPWNRKDIYVGQSPLFLAERIEKPLLLLHGDIDNNVPPGESYQMFAALKLLGKDVALVTFTGQQHFILEYKKRLQWMRTIIAWWDKYLKNQPEHWDHMYKN
jgi:dipeptidyl aminopeptidase/acylaminoacyl peptidase